MGGPAHGFLAYLDTLLEYHLPGLDHAKLTDGEYAQKIAHLAYIRQEEGKHNLH